MGMKWTEEQQKVINLRNRNILVSAAAGSGKTAVLVERIITLLTQGDNPLDVDRLLIVTFTEAAAAEMKDRIRSAVERKLEEDPGNIHLERQATLIHSAMITTIHSFCLSVIRDHFHVIGIDPGFRVAEEGELRLLRQDVLEDMLEQYYADEDKEFLDFVEKFGTGKNDRKIEDIILTLYDYSRSYPMPEQWLNSCVLSYRMENQEQLEKILEPAVYRVKAKAGHMQDILHQAVRICREPDGPYMYEDMLESDLSEVECIMQAKDFQCQYDAVTGFSFKRLSSKKDESVSEEKKNMVKKLRDQAKKMLGSIREIYFYAPVDVWKKDMEAALPSMEMLSRIVIRFSELFSDKKKDRNIIDFDDMEHLALKILTEPKEGELVPSHTAREYREQFAEVMIDEYQDSNLVQETILTSVSGISEGKYNIFMVGDVKQSIYSFRLSRPELFMEKYHKYTLEDGCMQRIDLHKNFRSRREVLDSVNYIFRRIMKKELGGIEYDDSAALYPGADFPALPENDTYSFKSELLLLDKDSCGNEDVKELEARMAAAKIRELLQYGKVTDKDSGEFRNIRYSDIVILTRSIVGWAEVFTSVFASEGIPAYSVSREGYFETYEVSVLLDYLKILDNACQDLPLTAVLTSPFGGLNPEELSQIRIAHPDLKFYEAVAVCAASEEFPLHGKLAAFMSRIKYFRKKVPYTPIHELLTEIIESTGFGTYVCAMPGGSQRLANVEMLVDKAEAFEGTSYKGLFNFVRYIGQLQKYDVDYGEAGILDEQADTVKIMSIHKSKGLEFPVVFVCGLGKQFNTQDQRKAVLLHPDMGVGLDDIDLTDRTRVPTFLKKMIKEEITYENLAEEMRILYVALTRAKEKLILTGCMKGVQDGLINDKEIFFADSAKNCLDWIVPALLTGKNRQYEQKSPVDITVLSAEDISGRPVERAAEEITLDVLSNWDISKRHDELMEKTLKSQMDFTYPYENEEKMKLKFTVTELKKQASLEEESGEEMFPDSAEKAVAPGFMQEGASLKGASRGSAYHKLLELLDFSAAYDRKSLVSALDRLQSEGKLSVQMAEAVRPEDILYFLNCSVGKRMTKAAANGKLFREQPFVLGVDASEIYPDDHSGEKILVQGIIDVYFEEERCLTVLDYKTDRVRTAEELREKYHAQLEYYAQALTRLTNLPVKEKIIYSFALGEEIKV